MTPAEQITTVERRWLEVATGLKIEGKYSNASALEEEIAKFTARVLCTHPNVVKTQNGYECFDCGGTTR